MNGITRLIKPKRGLLHRVARKWQLYALIAPSVCALLVFHYFPIYGLQIAFQDYRPSLGIWGSKWVGLKHFSRFLSYSLFWSILWNTIRISLCTLATFPLPVILALMMNEVRSKTFKRTVQTISYAPHFVSTVVVCSMTTLFLNYSNGIINNMSAMLGLPRIDYLTESKYFTMIYVVSGLWQSIGWNTIVYIATLAAISPELYEAARMDGASRWQVLRHINIPCILPTVVIMFILQTGRLLSVGYEKILLLQNPLNLETSRVISTYVYEIGLVGGQFSYSAAIGLFNNITNILIILIVNSISNRISNISVL